MPYIFVNEHIFVALISLVIVVALVYRWYLKAKYKDTKRQDIRLDQPKDDK